MLNAPVVHSWERGASGLCVNIVIFIMHPVCNVSLDVTRIKKPVYDRRMKIRAAAKYFYFLYLSQNYLY